MPRLWTFFISVALTLTIASLINRGPASDFSTPENSHYLPKLIEKILPGVVNISSVTIENYTVLRMDDFFRFWGIPKERRIPSLGSGFVIDAKKGYILTNNHVVDRASEVLVILHNKKQYRAQIIGKDPKLDLALLQVKTQTGKIPPLLPLQLDDSDSVQIGETAIAIGNPFGLQHTVTKGIISAKNRTIGIGPLDNFLQTDADINPGNSGGPLFNIKGQVIGINTVIYSKTGQSSGLGFAIPINSALNILDDLKKHGRVPRPWLGILSERVTPQIARYYQLRRNDGVLIYNLVEGAPADRFRLRRGDIIIEVEGTPIKEPNDIEKRLYEFRPGQKVSVKFQRGSKIYTRSIQLSELPQNENQLPKGII